MSCTKVHDSVHDDSEEYTDGKGKHLSGIQSRGLPAVSPPHLEDQGRGAELVTRWAGRVMALPGLRGTGYLVPKLIGDVALQSRGVRLPPKTWERIDRLSDGKYGPWLRKQIEAILSLAPDMPKQHENVQNEQVEFEECH